LILLLTLFFLVSTIVCFILYRNIISPPVILSIVWLIVFGFYYFSPFVHSYDSPYYLIFIVGHLLFITGFILVSTPSYTKRVLKINKPKVHYYLNKRNFKIILFIESIILINGLINIRGILSSNYMINWWFSLKYAQNMGYYDIGMYFGNAVLFSFVISYVISGLYFYNKDKHDKELTRLFVIQIILSLLFAILSLGRTYIVQLIIPIFFIYIIINSKNIFNSLKLLIFFMGIILSTFFIINSLKYVNSTSSMIDSFYGYLTLSVRAFIDWSEINDTYMYGQNTFRFFFSFFNALGFNIETRQLVEEFISIGNNFTTNVYTIYKWYYSDFGWIYAVFMQLLLGAFHGVLYKNVLKKGTLTAIILLSIFYYPLVMQFFQDQYFSLTSTWIQTFFWILVVFKSGILVVKRELQ
jgi:oligosaccharide repeat unit polymerase